MSNVVTLISALMERDIRVSLNGDKLKVSAPTGALTDDIKQQLQIHKEDLLDFLRRAQADSGKSITLADRNAVLPLTYAQQRLWILDKIQPNLAAYNMPIALRIRGALDIAAMQRTFVRIVERHEILRARLYEHDGMPAQRIDAVPAQVLTLHDEGEIGANVDVDATRRDAIAERLATVDAQTPFNLGDGPLFRASLTRLGENDFVLLANMHHIVSDGWSVDVLSREIAAIYASEAMGLPTQLQPLSVQYVDFAAWQHEWLGSEAHRKQLDYWKQQFHGAPALLKLPTDRPRPAQQTFNGDDYDFGFGKDLSQAIKQFCQQHNVTLFAVLLGAYQLVLSRYAQQDDICVAIPSAGRNRRELEGLIGFFVNVLIMRTQIGGNASVLDFVRNVKATSLAGFDNEDIPMEKIIEAIDINWNPAYPPLAQVGFALQNIGSANAGGKDAHTHSQLGNISIDSIGAMRKSAKYDMIFFVTEGDDFNGSIEYNTDLFNRATIERLATHVKHVLAQMTQNPQAHLANIAIASEAELRELLELPDQHIEALLPLTPNQRDLYLAHVIDPDTLVNNVGQSVEVHAAIDPQALRDALKKMVETHVLLRASLVASPAWYTDPVYWVIHRTRDIDLRIEDWSADNLSSQQVSDRVRERMYQPFDIHDQLYHVELIRLAEQHHLLLLIGNHMVFDGIALRVFNDQLTGLLTGRLDALPADNFARFIGQSLAGYDTPEALDFWRTQLAQCEPLTLPAAATTTTTTSAAGKLTSDRIRIGSEQLAALEAWCKSNDATLPQLLKALYGVLINSYARADADFQVRDTLAGRSAEFRATIGCMHQNAPFVFRQPLLQPAAALSELLQDVRALPRQIMRKRALISLSQLQRLADTGRCGFMYNFYSFEDPLDFNGSTAPVITYAPLEIEGQVQLIAKPMGDVLEIDLHYYDHLFPNLRFLERLTHLAQQVVNGAKHIGELSLLLPDEKTTLAQWNPPSQVFEQFPVHTRFEQMAERFADRIALSCDGAQWTYRELNERANQIAHTLITKGLRVGDFVGLAMERSLDLMAGILGILKANAAYVPLDPHFPPDRLAFILEDSQAQILLTHAAAGDGLGGFSGVTIALERDAAHINAQPTTNPLCHAAPDSTIYVLYTSGTTGRPKGCVVTHGNVARLMTATDDDFHFDENDVWTLFHSYAFDFTVWEMWGALLYGGKLVIVPYLLAREPNEFYELLLQHNVTVLNQTPSAFSQLIAVDAARNDVPALALRYVVFGGEALDFNALRTWVRRHGLQRPKLVNMYGITETTVHVTRYTLTEHDFEQPGSIVGKPIRDLHVHIVDRYGKPTPIGLPGEMRIAGPGVTKGYLKRDDLTAERFTTNTFIESLPAQQRALYDKLYHSGDLARFTPEGNIEYLGRIDLQVKIRGHRIELGEIMAQLAALDEVREAVVIVREDEKDDQRLVAYLLLSQVLLPEGQSELDINSVRSKLKVMLPDYMVPSHFIVLDAWPLTPTGKVDKKALPAPESEFARSAQYVAPVTTTEQRLCTLWADMLGVDQVGIDDNFFELGGHSLLAARLGNEVTKQFGKTLPLRTLFVEPTIRALARVLDEGETGEEASAIPLADRNQSLPLSFNQLRVWFVQKLGGVANAFNISTAVRIRGALDVDALRTAFEQVVQQHESMRTHFVSQGDDVYQMIDASIGATINIEPLSASADGNIEQAIRHIANVEALRPFDMATGPLWRLRLLQIDTNDHVLVICIHHIITDGLSLQMLLAEVGERYAAQVAHRTPQVLPSTVQYADFAVWQRERLDNQKLQALLGYWERQLGGAPTLLNLPTDRPRPPRQTFNGDVLRFTLDDALAGQLKAFCRQHNVTTYVLLLSALQLLLARYSRQNDICVGSAVSGRIRPELQNVLGFFANTVVMRTRFSDNPSVLALITDVRNTVIGAMEHQELPFEQLVDHLKIPRNLSHTPLYQVAFTMTQTRDAASEMLQMQFGGLQFEAIANTLQTSQVDLTMAALESDSGIGCAFEYNTDLFDRSTIERLAQNLAHIVRSMLQDAARPVQTIELVERDALHALLKIERDNTQRIAPLTSTLRDLYLAHIINPSTEINSLGQYVVINHAVDVERMRAAAQALVDATDILRTRFVACDQAQVDDVYMVVDKYRRVDFRFSDVRADMAAYDQAGADAELRTLIESLIYVPYDIHADALYRFELLQLANDRFALVLAGNHILFDGVSSTSCLKQLLAFYEQGDARVFAGNGFFDYIEAARRDFDTRDTLGFWRTQLATVEPLNFSKPSGENHSGFVSLHGAIDHDHIEAIQAYCKSNNLTIPRYFRSLYGVLIREYCRADGDFIVRDTLAGRSTGHEQTLGCYHRLVPFVFEQSLFKNDNSLAALFAYNADYVSRVREHSRISLVEQRRLAASSAIGFMFNFYQFDYRVPFENEPVALEFLGPIAVDGQVQLILERVDDNLRMHLHYPASIFDDLRLLERLVQLSRQVLDGAQTVGELSLLLPDELAAMQQWSSATPHYAVSPVHHQFERMAELHGDRIAVVCDGVALTYRELNQQANRIAHALIAAGAGVGHFVGLCLERSNGLMAALLGILKSGAAYVPLDPHFPADRLQFIIEDADCTLLLTSREFENLLPQFSGHRLLLDDIADSAAANDRNPQTGVSATDTIYVLYTSGTTGKPKGCIVTHANVSRLFACTDDFYRFNHHDVWTLFHSYAFDFTVWEMWGALLYGGKLVIVPYAVSRAPDAFYQLLIEHKVSVLNQTPSAFSQLIAIDATHPEHTRLALRYVVFGGEALDFNALRTWRRHHDLSATRLINMYGITETTVHVTLYPVTADDLDRGGSIIGKPISDLHTHIVNDRGQRQPIGIAGEILVAGPGVTRGYLKRDDLTAQRFIENPFARELPTAEQGAYRRLYRSGDLGRYRADGNIDYLGRIDFQVKIRGHRIELGEIEHHMAQLDNVREAIVLVLGDAENKQLIGYLLCDNRNIDIAAARAQLSQHLPDYMIPASFVVITEWPLTPTGKVDKKALPPPETALGDRSHYVAPRTDIEKALALIWEQLLGVSDIGIHDNFFFIGGHSLIAVKLMSRLREHFGIELPLRTLFEQPTIEQLAVVIATSTAQSLLPPITPVDHAQPLPLSFNQQRLWFVQQMDPTSSAYNMPVALRIRGALDANALQQAFRQLIERHAVLRTRFVSINDTPYQQIETSFDWQLERKTVSDRSDTALVALAAQLAAQPFDIAKGPLLRATLFELDGNDHVLVAVMHHIASDGWSMQLIMRELAALYANAALHAGLPLPTLPVQYADFAAWQREHLQGDNLQAQLAWWREQLTDAPRLLNLPTDRPRPPVQTDHGAATAVQLSPQLSQQVHTFAKQHQLTPFMVMLAAYQLLLAKYAGQNDVCVGMPIAGRHQRETENLIGFFVNALIIRTRMDDNPRVRTLLARVKDTVLGAFAHQDVPTETIIEHLNVPRSLAYSPIAQVGFNFLPAAQAKTQKSIDMGALAFEAIDSGFVAAKYDMIWSFNDDGSVINGGIEYRTDLFDAHTVAQMAAHYQQLLGAMMADTDCGVATLQWLPAPTLYAALNLDATQFERIEIATAMQRDLHFDTVLNPDNRRDYLGVHLDLPLVIDIDKWQQAVALLHANASALRTRIVTADKPWLAAAYAVVATPNGMPNGFAFHDLRAAAPPNDEIMSRIDADVFAPYAQDFSPLYRCRLYQLADDHFIATVTAHHAIVDGVGVISGMLMQLLAAYEALVRSDTPQFTPDVYGDYYALNHRNIDTEEAIAFWKDAMHGVEPLTAYVEPTRAGRSGNYHARVLRVEREHWEAIGRYCKEHRTTPALYLKALYSLLLASTCNAREDFYFQEITLGRPKSHAMTAGLYFEQTPFIMRKQVIGADSSISDLLEHIGAARKQMRDGLQLSNGLQNTLLPQSRALTIFNFYPMPMEFDLLGHKVASVQHIPEMDNCINFVGRVSAGELDLLLTYTDNVFTDVAFLERIVHLSRQLLSGVTRLGDLTLTFAGEQPNLLETTHRPRYSVESVQALFENQVVATPDAIAIEQGNGATGADSITYAALNRRANQLAHFLRQQHSVERGDIVGCCFAPGIELMVAILGAIKAGAAYVPMDANYPQERLAYILTDSNARVLLTESCLEARLPVTDCTRVMLDRDRDAIAAMPQTNPSNDTALDDLLYVIYTSGSTGRPKGAGVKHRGELNLLAWYVKEFRFNRHDSVLIISAIGFDLTQKNLLAPLVSGGRIIMPEGGYDDQVIRTLIEARQVSIINCAPSAFYPLVEHASDVAMLNSLRLVLFGGEPIRIEKLLPWLTHTHCVAQIVNMYGPTECTDIATFYRITEPQRFVNQPIPIGKANDNVQLYIVDASNRLLPPGVPGELLIGGEGVGAGYLGKPDLTEKAFIKNPFGEGTLYRTGDLVRELHGGNIEFINRIDFQVKLRGLRIELGEIEFALCQLQGVSDALVLVRDERLIAYVTTAPDVLDSITTSPWRAQLATYLPDYMVPHVLVALLRWPLTPNGKIDRNALPSPDANAATAYVAPRNSTEAALSELFAEVLGLERVGIHDDFFALGGQSLIATQLMARIRRRFDIDLGLREIFDKHSVAELATVVDGKLASGSRALPPLLPVDRNQWLPLSYTQHRLWVMDKLSPGSAAYNMPSAFRIRGALDVEAIRRAIMAVVERHESLRFSYGEENGEPFLIINDSGNYRIDDMDLRQIRDEKGADECDAAILRAAQQHSLHSFDLAHGPLFICTLITVADDDHALLINMHHTVSDGLSLSLMLREIGLLYMAYTANQPAALPPLVVQYADFAHWQRQWLTQEQLQSQIDYWTQKLRGAPELLNLPADKPRPAKMSGKGATVEVDLGADLAHSITAFARDHSVTPFILLLTAFNILLSRYSQQKDICVGIPIAGRNDAQLEPLIGLFLSGLVIRTDLAGNPTALQMLQRVRAGVMEDFAHQDAPIDKVLETLNIARNPAYPPLTQVGFQVLNNEMLRQGGISNVSSSLLPNLTIESVGTQHTTARYDITLNIFHNDNTLSAGVEYNTDIFVESTVIELVQRLGELTQHIIAAPHTPISKIDIISQQELLDELNCSHPRFSELWPLTAMQTDMVIDAMINPHTLQSSHGWCIDVHRPLDVALWQRCCQEFTDSQRLLRARLVRSAKPYADVAYLGIEPAKNVSVELIDLSGEAVDLDELNSEIRARIYRSYDVFNDELVWFAVYKISSSHFIVVCAAHHALIDGLSLHSMLAQLTTHYNSLAAGTAHAFSDDNFVQYVLHERQEIDSTDVRAFWREKLAQAEPLDFTVPSPVPPPAAFVKHSLAIDAERWKSMRQYCRRQRITPALYLKSLFGLMLNTYCRPDADFVMYEMNAGRSKEFAMALGCYIQQSPVVFNKSVFAPTNSVHNLIEYARNLQKQTRDQRMISVGALLEMLPRGRIGARFNYYHFVEPIDLAGETHLIEGDPSDPDNNIEFVVSDFGDTATLRLFFHAHLFADFDLLARLIDVSTQIIDNGVTTLGELQFVNAEERHRLLQAWNNTAASFDLSLCLHQRFELQCVRTPNRLAISDDSVQYSYQQLNTRANQLARHLQSKGIARGDLVGICLERSADFLVAILAIFKAGGAYVPMDAKYPDERIAYMRDNSQARVIVSHSALLEKVGTRDGLQVIALDRDWPRIALLDVKNVFGKCNARDFAYMIYTSGSTGLPKGALIRHDGAVNHIEAERAVLGFADSFSFLQTAPSSSDISVWQFLGPVTCGGCVVVLDEVTNAPKLFDLVQRHAVNLVELVPVALQLLMEHIRSLPPAQRVVPSLKWMMATGEAVPVEMVNAWLALYPAIPVVNAYGPTEAADDVIQCAIYEALESGRRSVPIGKPLPNMQVYILDDTQRLVPPGVPGEICISGVGVGGGYWHNAEKTASAFVANPFAANDCMLGDTIYRTGDLGRWLDDGSIEYLDRVDNQVKVRGYRIELGEVEAALGNNASVRECAVIVRDDMPGGAALVGYVVAHAGVVVDSHALRAQLRERLPDYMVPAAIVVLEKMPLTPAGKTDRKALPAPVIEGRTGEEFVAARNETEAALCLIWQEVLGVTKVGIHDNFFELGGHSLLAVRLLSRIEQAFGSKIPLATLFSAQTVAQLADILLTSDNGWSPLVPIRVTGELPPLFIVHAFGGMVMNYDKLAQALPADQPVYGLQAFGFEPGQQAFDNLSAMAAFYREAIVKKQPQGPYYLAGHSFGGIIAHEIARQFEHDGETVALLAMLDSFVPQPKAARRVEHDAQLLQLFVENNFGDVDVPWRLLQRLDHAALLDEVMKALGGAVTRDFLEAVLRVSHGFITMQTQYATRPVGAAITLLRPRGSIASPLLKLGKLVGKDELMGIDKLTQAGVTLAEVEGDHFRMLAEPAVATTAAALTRALELARSSQARG